MMMRRLARITPLFGRASLVQGFSRPLSTALLRTRFPCSQWPLHLPFSTYMRLRDAADKKEEAGVPLGSFKVDKPQLMIAFTCKKCDTRSSHTISKQAYNSGTVLIKCPGCQNRHLIADHLKIFNDDRITIEDIMKAQGESVSLTTDDLAFEDVPESLKNTIGHYAKDAPPELKNKLQMDHSKTHLLK